MFIKKLTIKYDFFIKYSAMLLLVVIPLYPKFPLFKVEGTFVSVRLEDFLLAFSALIVLPVIFKDLKRWLKDSTVIGFLLYLLVSLTSLVSAVFITKTIDPDIGILHLIRRIEYFTPFFIGYYAIYFDKKNLDLFIKTILLIIFVVFIYGMGQKYLHWPIIITQNQEYSKGVALQYREGSHINSTFAGHYDLASYLVLLMPTIVAFLVQSKINKILQLQFMGVFMAGLWLLVNSASRISFFTYLLSTAITLIILNKKRLLPIIVLISLLFTLSSQNMILRYKRVFDVVKNNYLTQSMIVSAQTINPIKNIQASPTPIAIEILEDRSTNIRLNVEWPRAIRAFVKNPLLGTGYSSITLATDNDYLRLLGETGLFGFLAFIIIILNFSLTLFKLILRNSGKVIFSTEALFTAGIAGSLVGILINAVFIDIFEASKFAIIFWLIFGMIKGIEKAYEKKD